MWRYEPETRTIRSVPSNHWVASMNSWDGAEDHQANARIIAAAPDLLAESRRLLARLQEMAIHPSHYAGLAAAIARATGDQ